MTGDPAARTGPQTKAAVQRTPPAETYPRTACHGPPQMSHRRAAEVYRMCRNGRQSALLRFFPMKPENFHGFPERPGFLSRHALARAVLPPTGTERKDQRSSGRKPKTTGHNPVMPKVIIFSKLLLLIGRMSGFLRLCRRAMVCFREKPAARSHRLLSGGRFFGGRCACALETPGLFSHRRVLRGEVTRRCYFGPAACAARRDGAGTPGAAHPPMLFRACGMRRTPGRPSLYS